MLHTPLLLKMAYSCFCFLPPFSNVYGLTAILSVAHPGKGTETLAYETSSKRFFGVGEDRSYVIGKVSLLSKENK